jgi:hypothetical protein
VHCLVVLLLLLLLLCVLQLMMMMMDQTHGQTYTMMESTKNMVEMTQPTSFSGLVLYMLTSTSVVSMNLTSVFTK